MSAIIEPLFRDTTVMSLEGTPMTAEMRSTRSREKLRYGPIWSRSPAKRMDTWVYLAGPAVTSGVPPLPDHMVTRNIIKTMAVRMARVTSTTRAVRARGWPLSKKVLKRVYTPAPGARTAVDMVIEKG